MGDREMKASLDNDLSVETVISAGATPARYRSMGIIRVPVGNNAELVYSRLSRSVDIFPSNMASLLDRCNQFKSIDEHAQECYRSLQAGREQMGSMISR